MTLQRMAKRMLELAATLGGIALLTPAYGQAGGEKPDASRIEFRKDRILVKPVPGVPAAALNALHAANSIRVARTFPRFGNVQILELPAALPVERAVAIYRQNPNVAYAEPDYIYRIGQVQTLPNDSSFSQLWGMNNTGQSGGTADADIDGPEAWTLRTDASSVIVGVIDTGIDYNHPDLAQNMWRNAGEVPDNGVDDDGNGYIDDVYGINGINNSGNPMDDQYHGTHVSGTIGGVGSNGIGVAGVAWNVRLMGLKFLDSGGSGSSSNAIKCIDYAIAKGAHILSNSWGGGGYSQALYDAIDRAKTAGIIFVAAAGNSNADTDATVFYPAGYRLNNVVAVASTDSRDTRSSFSNYGYVTTHLGAPGSNIYSTYPNNSYNSISGTSMATPHVSGALALLKAHQPGFSMAELIARLLTSTDATTGMSAVTVTGGRLNVYKALAGVTRPIPHFAVTPTAAAPGATVTFTDSSLGNITSRTLDFGDGSPQVSLNGTATHVYDTAGNYTATLTVSGPDGMATRTRTVVVEQNYTVAADTYQWVDTTGLSTLPLGDDAVSGAIALPFQFPFYGTNYSSLYIASNGFVTLGSNAGGTSWSNGAIPSAGTPNGAIYAYWDDLNRADSTAPGTIRYGATDDGNFVVSWEAVPIYGQPTLPMSFQIVLAPSGLVKIQYKEVQPANTASGAGRSATTGVEHPAGTMARQYSLNGSPLLANNSAIRFSRAGSTPPAAPANLTAQVSSGTQINLSWTDNSADETGFRIERSSGGAFAQVAVTAAGVTTYQNTGLTPGSTYSYRVIAVNTAGDSPASNIATATTPTPPVAPSGLTATAVSSAQINLAWTDNATDETGYRVLRSTDNATFSQIAQLATGAASYSSTGLQADTTYYFRVVAYNLAGESTFAVASAKTNPPPPPAAPGNLTATAVSSSQINLSWTDVTTEMGYRVEQSTDNVTFSVLLTLAANTTSYQRIGLSPNTTYYFRVVAVNSGGEAASTASAKTQAQSPSAPTNLSASGITGSTVTLSWRDNSSDEAGFILERIVGKVTVIISLGANATTYTDTGLKAGTKYSYRVKATAGSVSSAYSNTLAVTTLRR